MKLREIHTQGRHDCRIMSDEHEVVSCAKLKYTRWQISFQRGDGKSFTPPKGKLRTENFPPKKCRIYRSDFLRKKGR